eukprot:TRINITY_DN2979_c0_g2_i1.p1 TRINITY_DN2979_c0_g2~~TRINITY_DN2979_c0_g2_i1.p1  ORF type:complete len:1046 (-),score=65.80 TRINITY_DN2979_c0_g2_i1:547-3684(-)
MQATFRTYIFQRKQNGFISSSQHQKLIKYVAHHKSALVSSKVLQTEILTTNSNDTKLLDSTKRVSSNFQGLQDVYGIPQKEWIKLQDPIRYMGNEFGAVHKQWESANIRFALTYPEVYQVGSSNLGHIILYTVLNQASGVLCDRTYFPGADLIKLLKKYQKPLFAVESKQPLNAFDTIGFSLSYELGGTNILEMLKLSCVPITWQKRKENDGQRPWNVEQGSCPLIFAGGPTATSNPEPFADFFDFFALGDGEDLLVEISKCLKQCKQNKYTRNNTLYQLATQVKGVYVPQFYDCPPGFGGMVVPIRENVPERIIRRVAFPDPFNQIGLVPVAQTVHDRMTIEIRRGCTRGCRFCQPGMLTRPARDVEPDQVVQAVEQGLQKTGYNDFSLLSLSCSDYLSLPYVGLSIKNKLQAENLSLSLPSQRVDRFDDNIANIVSGNRARSLTFAPEAGTQRLRDIINKGLTNKELLRGIKKAWDRGWKTVKLYFMIGLPGETDQDVLSIAETIQWLQSQCRKGKQYLAVNVTISNFTPKPHTPFQWHSVSTEEFARKQDLLKEAFGKLNQVKVNFTPPAISAMEDFIGRGDRRIAKVIKRAWELGALNDAWWSSENKAFEIWNKAIQECGLAWKYRQVEGGEWNSLEMLGDARYRKQGGSGKGRLDKGYLADSRLDMPLPWDHIDSGVHKAWLKTDLQRALEAATVPDCSHSGLCSQCGVCGDELGNNVVFEPPSTPEFLGNYTPNTVKAQRLRFTYVKKGSAVYIGNLDLLKVFQHAAKRAGLPVTSDRSPFNSKLIIQNGLSLGLGVTGSHEMVEIYLSEKLSPFDALNKLQQQLVQGLELINVEEIPLKRIDGVYTESLGALINKVTYQFLIESVQDHIDFKELIKGIQSMENCVITKQTKRGNIRKININQFINYIKVLNCSNTELSEFIPEIVQQFRKKDSGSLKWSVLEYCTNVSPEGGHVTPQQLLELFQSLRNNQIELVHVHRSGINLRQLQTPILTEYHMIQLRKLIKYETFMALKSRYLKTDWSYRLRDYLEWDRKDIYSK